MRQRLMQILSSDETSHDASFDAAACRFWGHDPRSVADAPVRQSEGARVIELAQWKARKARTGTKGAPSSRLTAR